MICFQFSDHKYEEIKEDEEETTVANREKIVVYERKFVHHLTGTCVGLPGEKTGTSKVLKNGDHRINILIGQCQLR